MNILEALQNNGFQTIDYIVVAIYIVILVGMGLFLSRSKKGEEKSSNDYFLAGNTLTWWAVGASLIAANISAEQFIGMSGTSYADGIATAAYELMAAVTLIVVGKFLLPVMLKRKIFTIPQFLRERYNDGVGLAFSILWLFLYVFVNLTSVAWLGALAIEQILGLQGAMIEIGSFTISVRMVIILLLYVIAGVYSIYGGLASVAWTDVLQVTFLVSGGLITAFFALKAVGGDSGALAGISNIFHDLTTGEHLTDSHLHLVVQQSHGESAFANVPGIAAVVGAVWITNLGYWGFNQYIIQKGLAAKSIDEAKKGLVFAGFLKVLIPFIVCIPGVCAYLIWNDPELHGKLMASGLLSGDIKISDDAYPFLIRNFTPVAVKGLSFAALTAAVISSLASMFNSTSTIFTMDIYKQFFRKEAGDKELVNVGRLTSICALVIALLAVYPIMGGADQAFQIIQEYSGFVYPGIVVIFGLGLLWKRSSGTAAVATAIGTFAFSIFFKLLLPETPFLIRMGYVFIVLVIMFVGLSLKNKNTEPTQEMSENDINTQSKYSKILACAAGVSALLGVIGCFVEPMRNLGFEGFFFMAAILAVLAIYLNSNAKDKVQDKKALKVDLSLFKTAKDFNLGAIGIIVLLAILYIALW